MGHDFESTDVEGKALVVRNSQNEVAFIDSSGLCLIPGGCGWTINDYLELVNASCEVKWTVDDVQTVGERIWNEDGEPNPDTLLRLGL